MKNSALLLVVLAALCAVYGCSSNIYEANRVLEGLILDENKARIEAESNNEIVRVGRPAREPSQPLSIFETSLSIFD